MYRHALRAVSKFVLLLALSLSAPFESSAKVPQRNLTEVTISRSGDGLLLHYRFARSNMEFRFDPHTPVAGRSSVHVVTSGLVLKDGVIAGSRPFLSFSLLVRPDVQRLDATYPLLTRVGAEGLLLYAPGLSQDKERGITRWKLALPRGFGSTPGWSADGFIFMGPASYVEKQEGLALVASPETDPALRARIRQQAKAFMGFYSDKLGRAPPKRAVVVIDHDKTGARQGFIGDVTSNGVVLLQLTRDMGGSGDAQSSMLSRFLGHELFHLWNGGKYRDIQNVNGEWLREGAAEYASWLAGAALTQEQGILEEQITKQLEPCMTTLGDDALVRLQDQRAQTSRYSCGAIAHWLADVGVRASGGESVLATWAKLLARPNGYNVRDFERALPANGKRTDPLVSLLHGGGRDRWTEIFTLLDRMGVRVVTVAPGNEALRAAALHTLLRQDCTGDGIGYETIGLSEPPKAVVLRTEPMHPDHKIKCALLSGDPHLLSVNGFSTLGDWTRIFQDVTSACSANSEVIVALRRAQENDVVRIRCNRPALVPPPVYRVLKALPGPTPAAITTERL